MHSAIYITLIKKVNVVNGYLMTKSNHRVAEKDCFQKFRTNNGFCLITDPLKERQDLCTKKDDMVRKKGFIPLLNFLRLALFTIVCS